METKFVILLTAVIAAIGLYGIISMQPLVALVVIAKHLPYRTARIPVRSGTVGSGTGRSERGGYPCNFGVLKIS